MKPINWRVPLAFLLSSVVPCGLTAIGLGLGGPGGSWNSVRFGATMMIIVSLAVNVVICLPTYLILRRRGAIRLKHCLGVGAGAAVAFTLVGQAVLMFSLRDGRYSAWDSGGATIVDGRMTLHGYAGALWSLIPDIILGVAIAACFRVIAFWRRNSAPTS